ncbi:unnamed protein product [Blepharisma stoltei]|uniref:CS domain-containing protein n=1 Tax=Blepharisma stoltei TaxID=1481888 RepID=A0AAU9K845_9CILI|nr:unnamed protein product [Blepharisma stoltei]
MFYTLTLLSLFSVISYCKTCLEITADSEDKYIKELSKDVEFDDKCLKDLMVKQWWQASIELSTFAIQKDQQIDPSFKAEALNTKKKVEKLISLIENQGKINTVSPAFQWAQSPDTVFIEVKFSHRWDYPGCLEVSDPEVSIKEDRITFTGMCSRSNQRIKIALDLELYNKIVPEASTYSMKSGGRLNFTLKKYEVEAWAKPNKGKKLSNATVWWEMRDKYRKEMNALTGEEDDEDYKKPKKTGLEDLMDNPNVVIKDSYVDGKKIDNTKEKQDL